MLTTLLKCRQVECQDDAEKKERNELKWRTFFGIQLTWFIGPVSVRK